MGVGAADVGDHFRVTRSWWSLSPKGSALAADAKGSARSYAIPDGISGASPLAHGGPRNEDWSALAHLVGQRDKMRLSKDRKKFPAQGQTALTVDTPRYPAAVYTYDLQGCTRMFVVDLDAPKPHRGETKITRTEQCETGGLPDSQVVSVGTGNADVERDCAAIAQLVADCGGRVFTDRSPSGGRHVYIPLAKPVPFHEARSFALDLAAKFPTMDATPMLNIGHGLIRPPGSPHKTGGHQRLDGNLDEAVALATEGNPLDVWRRLRTAVPARPTSDRGRVDDDTAGGVPRRGGPLPLDPYYETIARTGQWDDHRYATSSEARHAVITSAAWAGHTLASVLLRIDNGVWPGLAALYAKYRGASRAKAVAADFAKAVTQVREKRSAKQLGNGSVYGFHTSKPDTRGGLRDQIDNRDQFEVSEARRRTGSGEPLEYLFLRAWWRAMLLVERELPPASVSRMVLRAVGEAAMKAGSRFVQFGVRNLSLAAGAEHSTVAGALRELRAVGEDGEEGLLRLVDKGRGLSADLYELRIPPRVAEAALGRPAKSGEIHGMRAAFRELGRPAAFVYEAVEQATEPATVADLIRATGLSRAGVYEAIQVLCGFDLAVFVDGRCSLTGADLNLLAEALGCADEVRHLIGVHRTQRILWRLFLAGPGTWAVVDVDGRWEPPERPPPDDDGQWWIPPPPDGAETAWAMAERVRGSDPSW